MIYINGLGAISPVGAGQNTLPASFPLTNNHVFNCIEPNYNGHINERLLRRMARIIKMSVTASSIALKDANCEKPDAIITATGLGCLEDTEDFLKQLIIEQERLLSPTAFIKSTHNTIGGQIALLQNNSCYNMTYSHRWSSFESALLDAMLLLHEKEAKQVLVGGIDELSDTSIQLLQRLGCISFSAIDGLPLGGEGASFLVLSDEPSEKSYAAIAKVAAYHNIENPVDLFLREATVAKEEIDLVLSSGKPNTLPETATINYPSLCGEYHTSTAFACWLGSLILREQTVPSALIAGSDNPTAIRNVLIHHSTNTNQHSLILLRQC